MPFRLWPLLNALFVTHKEAGYAKKLKSNQYQVAIKEFLSP
jgi:hypothetical protein